MQKIAFVSMVLLFGLFSLQIGIGNSLKAQISTDTPAAKPILISPATHFEQTNKIVYVQEGDSIVVLNRVDCCIRL